MKINIYSLYLTYNKGDRDYLYNIVKDVIKNNNGQNIKILHIRFHDKYKLNTLKNNKIPLDCEYITILNGKFNILQLKIKSINHVIKLYSLHKSNGINVFMYCGHSDGIYLIHNKIHILSVEDYMHIIKKTIKKKADYIMFDACLCGTINMLNLLKHHTKYVIASPSYYTYLSLLQMKNLFVYPENINNINNTEDYGKNIIKEYIKITSLDFKYTTFMVNLVLYSLNDNINKLAEIVKNNKNNFEMYDCSINKNDYYYVDIHCGLKNIGYDSKYIKKLIDSIAIYRKYYDIGKNVLSKMTVILERPNNITKDLNEFYVN